MSTVVLLSGGMDSTALASTLGPGGFHAVSVDYGQRHGARELAAARAIAKAYEVPHVVVDLAPLRAILGGSALTSDLPVPEGHYAEATMAATVVPNRNAILLMVAVGYAQAHDCTRVLAAMHAGDHPIYPDCRPEFVAAANHAAYLATEGHVHIAAPFAGYSKADIARIGQEHGAPFALTWSCYKGGQLHCGRCGTCTERAAAFDEAGVPDPTEYADDQFWRHAMAAGPGRLTP